VDLQIRVTTLQLCSFNFMGCSPHCSRRAEGTLWVVAEVVLEIKNLTRRFGPFTAVDDLTLSVNWTNCWGRLHFIPTR
jgi:hypothetical protein